MSVSRVHSVKLPNSEEKHYVGKRTRKNPKRKENLRIALRLTEYDSLVLYAAVLSTATGASGFYSGC